MSSQTFDQPRRLTEPTEANDNWHHVEVWDPGFVDGVQAAIESLRALAPDWDGYGAPVIDPAVIEAAKTFIAQLPEKLAFRPRVVPGSGGTLQLEWHDGTKALELEFESPNSIRYLQWHPDAGVEEEDSFPVTDISKAVDLIRCFMAGSHR
jgi:hypothetical protein